MSQAWFILISIDKGDNILKELFKELEKIHSKLSNLFDTSDKNFCQYCHFCCTHLIKQGVNPIEYDYLRLKLKDKKHKVQSFEDYINKKTNSKDELLYKRCPFYSDSKKGCSIYNIRPVSCRFYGRYSIIPPPLFCSFHGWTVIYPVREFYQIVPFIKDFIELKNLI